MTSTTTTPARQVKSTPVFRMAWLGDADLMSLSVHRVKLPWEDLLVISYRGRGFPGMPRLFRAGQRLARNETRKPVPYSEDNLARLVGVVRSLCLSCEDYGIPSDQWVESAE